MNRILCTECYELVNEEEKCCSHGTIVGITCSECGKVRTHEAQRYWHCTGSEPARLDRSVGR